MLFMGIDIGTQGVRGIIVNESGDIVAGKSIPFATLNESNIPGHYEQLPQMWWNAVTAVVSECTRQLRSAGSTADAISSIAIDGTSGTVLPVDSAGTPLGNALMYNDTRSFAQVEKVRQAAAAHEQKMGLRFNSSFALPRVLWFRDEQPEIYEKAHRIIHQTDYIVGCLCGEFGVSDYSNSLKTGYDLVDETWPEFLKELNIDSRKLPEIVRPGMPIAPVRRDVAQQLGLSPKTMVVAGATDGYASALAAGAVRTGDWASIIGTTLVIKGVSDSLIIDPTGSSYCHRLPTGSWMVGGASNVGGRSLNARFGTERFQELNAWVDRCSPTGVLMYPITGRGERYPFVDPNAGEFIVGDVSDERVLYTAIMEGVGLTERLAYELNIANGCTVGDQIFTSGGACKSDEWLRIRASILNRSLKVPKVVDAAMGMALVAASSTMGGLERAAEQMIHFAKVVDPVVEKAASYEEIYQRFYEACCERFAITSGK